LRKSPAFLGKFLKITYRQDSCQIYHPYLNPPPLKGEEIGEIIPIYFLKGEEIVIGKLENVIWR